MITLQRPDMSRQPTSADLVDLVRIINRKLKKIQYRDRLIDGCLAGIGLTNRTLVMISWTL
jgi:hypothetical protein